MKWNFLVVDDDPVMAGQTSDILQNKRTLSGEEIVCEVCASFEEAKNKVLGSRYDLIVLDLQDDVGKVELMGKAILDLLREAHFTPVVFYTGHSHKVSMLETPFVKVVAKGEDDADNLRLAVASVFSTGLPKLIRFIQEQQRNYLWEHVDQFWQKSGPICDVKDLACLLSKRLSNALRGESVRRNLDGVESGIAHPIEMYVWPTIGESIQTGDIFKLDEFTYVVLNPACDFAQAKVSNVIVAECVSLEACPEYLELVEQKKAKGTYSNNQLAALKSIIGDNRKGKKIQPDRFKYLPKTVFMNAAVVDFQSLRSLSVTGDELARIQRIATLDTPFVESLLSKFSRYYGRIGTPDLNAEELAKGIAEGV